MDMFDQPLAEFTSRLRQYAPRFPFPFGSRTNSNGMDRLRRYHEFKAKAKDEYPPGIFSFSVCI